MKSRKKTEKLRNKLQKQKNIEKMFKFSLFFTNKLPIIITKSKGHENHDKIVSTTTIITDTKQRKSVQKTSNTAKSRK